MKTSTKIIISVLCTAIVLLTIFFAATPAGRTVFNNWKFAVQKADDSSNYETLQKVSDNCRAMMASYTKDKLIYAQYKDSDVTEERSWAQEAKMRANSTASQYNNYVLKNDYVWKGNIPSDICQTLDYID